MRVADQADEPGDLHRIPHEDDDEQEDVVGLERVLVRSFGNEHADEQ